MISWLVFVCFLAGLATIRANSSKESTVRAAVLTKDAAPASPASALSSGVIGFDYSGADPLNLGQFLCMREAGFTFYNQRGYGSWSVTATAPHVGIDANLCSHLDLASQAGLVNRAITVQLLPRFKLNTDSLFVNLKSELNLTCPDYSDINIYVAIEGHKSWNIDPSINRATLEGVMTSCKNQFSHCGIFTSAAVWGDVFGDVSYTNANVLAHAPLWLSESSTYSAFQSVDFSSFNEDLPENTIGGWSQAKIKQFAVHTTELCGVSAGFDWSSQSSTFA